LQFTELAYISEYWKILLNERKYRDFQKQLVQRRANLKKR
jgi:hypothetical protein